MRDTQIEIKRLYKKHRTFNPYEIADAMGIIIHYMDLGCTRGFCYTSRRIRQIFLNSNMPDYMKRFVLAHELGHLIMHPNHNAPFLQSTFFSMDRYELEANKFAVDLIITDGDLEVMYEYSIDSLAAHYGLPREVIELRFK